MKRTFYLKFCFFFFSLIIFDCGTLQVWEKEAKYVPQNLIDEMDGIAEGVCSVLGSSCNTTEWSNNVKQLNMLPEVIRMAW